MYGHLKVALADLAVEALTPVRTRTNELLEDRAELQRILLNGANKATQIADATVKNAYDRVGFL